MVTDTNALIGYCQSDEITLVYPARSVHPYGGRRNKINTLFAARAGGLSGQDIPT
jgi:tRNA(His) 5'-end guanylyltransferase